MSCSAYNCKNRGHDTYDKNNQLRAKKVRLHRFPLSDAKRLKKWIHQTRLKAWKPTKSSRLCSEHFEEKYLITPSTGRGVRLRNDAIPTIFSFPSQFQKKVICELMQVYFSVESFWLGLFQNGYYFDTYDKTWLMLWLCWFELLSGVFLLLSSYCFRKQRERGKE